MGNFPNSPGFSEDDLREISYTETLPLATVSGEKKDQTRNAEKSNGGHHFHVSRTRSHPINN